MAEIPDEELARLREAARLLSEVIEFGDAEEVSDERLEAHGAALVRWRDGHPPELDDIRLRAEHAYLVGMAAPDDLRTMRQELAREHESKEAAPPGAA